MRNTMTNMFMFMSTAVCVFTPITCCLQYHGTGPMKQTTDYENYKRIPTSYIDTYRHISN